MTSGTPSRVAAMPAPGVFVTAKSITGPAAPIRTRALDRARAPRRIPRHAHHPKFFEGALERSAREGE